MPSKARLESEALSGRQYKNEARYPTHIELAAWEPSPKLLPVLAAPNERHSS